MRVAGIIAAKQGNVIKLEHNQFVSTNRNAAVELRITMEAFGTDQEHPISLSYDLCRNAAVELRITMEAFGTDHKKEILDALEEAGFRPKLATASL